MNEDRVRRYVDRHDDPTVPQVLGRFELPPAAADDVRKMVESPDSGGIGRGGARKNLYRHVVTPSRGGWGGYPPYPSPVGGSTCIELDDLRGGLAE